MRTDATKVTQECYTTIIEASLYSSVIWNTFWEHSGTTQIHQKLLLTDSSETLRRSIKLKILSICGGHLPSSCPLDKADIAARYWGTIANILPGTVQKADQSDQLFELAQHVFRVYDEYHRSEVELRLLTRAWSSLLLTYSHAEIPGRYEVDHVVLGFTKLMLCALPSLKSFKKPLNAGRLMSSIFYEFLFPRYSRVPIY
jgi:ubiquitin carboxyl-terminal hydrolase 34